jgi:branched-chain amino acid transport system substrate-binding protein
LSRANIMKQAQSLKNFKQSLLLPGITMNTGPNDHAPIEQAQLSRFNGKQWVLFGEVLGGGAP